MKASQAFFERINSFLMDYWGLKEPFVYVYSIFSSLFFTSTQLADSDTRDSTTSLGRQSLIKNWITVLSSESAPSLILIYSLFSSIICMKYGIKTPQKVPLYISLNTGFLSLISLSKVIKRNYNSVNDIKNQAIQILEEKCVGDTYNLQIFKDEINNLDEISFRQILGWIFQRPSLVWNDVNVITNITFSEENDRKLELDIFTSNTITSSELKPVLLFIHGGAWFTGSRKISSLPLLYNLAHRGWIVVSTSYGLLPKVKFPENLRDCKRALKWVKENIYKYNGNKDYIIIGGESAGSHLALLLALTADKDNELNKGINGDLSVQGCVDFYGVYDMTRFFKSKFPRYVEIFKPFFFNILTPNCWDKDTSSPEHLVTIGNKLPTTLIIHGDCDSIVKYKESCDFNNLLKKSEVSSSLLTIPYGKHCFNYFLSPRTYVTCEVISIILDFDYKQSVKYF